MAKINAPNKQYTGISAGVTFVNGVGEASDTELLKWFKRSGYDVEVEKEDESENEFKGKTVDDLKVYAAENGIDIGNSTSVNGIIKKIQDSRKKAGE